MKDEKIRNAIEACCNDLELTDEEKPVLLTDHSYDRSIIGITDDGHRVIYSFDKMITEFMEDEDCEEFDALEWLEYNTMRAMPYIASQFPDTAPIIVHSIEDVMDKYGD